MKTINYTLMNRDIKVLDFKYVEVSSIEFYFEEDDIPVGIYPWGYTDIESWLRSRKAPNQRKYLNRLPDNIKVNTLVDYITATRCVSLNDTYWVKCKDESVTWKEVSPYTNEIGSCIAHLAFKTDSSNMSFPELSTGGVFPKCWKRDGEKVFLLKGGTSENNELEVINEVLASFIYKQLLGDKACSYEYEDYLGTTWVSKCELFTDEDYGFLSMASYLGKSRATVGECITAYKQAGCDVDLFRRMLIADAIVLNIDRHLGNFGFRVRNISQATAGMAPVFDYNKALLPELSKDLVDLDWATVTKYMVNQVPTMGTDFVSMARQLMDTAVRQDLLALSEIDFTQFKNLPVSEKYLQRMTDIIRLQLDLILEDKRNPLDEWS